MKTVLFVRS